MQNSLCTTWFYALWIYSCSSVTDRNSHDSQNWGSTRLSYFRVTLFLTSGSFLTSMGKSLQTSQVIFLCSSYLSGILSSKFLVLWSPWTLSSVSWVHRVHWALAHIPLPTPDLGKSFREVSWGYLVCFLFSGPFSFVACFSKSCRVIISYIPFIYFGYFRWDQLLSWSLNA